MDRLCSGREEQPGSFARTFASLTPVSSRVLSGWSVICGLGGEKLFSLSPFLPPGFWLFRKAFSSETAGYCQFCVGLWATAPQCSFPRQLWRHLCLLSPLTAWASVYSLWQEMERKKDKSRSVLLIRLFARPAALWWETGSGSGAAAAISLTPSRDWCVIEGLCEIMSISSRSSVPLGLASVTHQDFLKNCQSSNNAPLILWLATSFAWSGWCPFRSCPAGHLFFFSRLLIASVSTMKNPNKNRNVWVWNKIWAKVTYNSTNRPSYLNRIICLHPFSTASLSSW